MHSFPTSFKSAARRKAEHRILRCRHYSSCVYFGTVLFFVALSQILAFFNLRLSEELLYSIATFITSSLKKKDI